MISSATLNTKRQLPRISAEDRHSIRRRKRRGGSNLIEESQKRAFVASLCQDGLVKHLSRRPQHSCSRVREDLSTVHPKHTEPLGKGGTREIQTEKTRRIRPSSPISGVGTSERVRGAKKSAETRESDFFINRQFRVLIAASAISVVVTLFYITAPNWAVPGKAWKTRTLSD